MKQTPQVKINRIWLQNWMLWWVWSLTLMSWSWLAAVVVVVSQVPYDNNNNNIIIIIIQLWKYVHNLQKYIFMIYTIVHVIYGIKNCINHKNTITVSITISQIHSLRLRCDQYPLNTAQCFKLSQEKRKFSLSDIKKEHYYYYLIAEHHG